MRDRSHLTGAVHHWPTPQAHDAHAGNAERVGRFGTKHGGRNLNDEVMLWPTPKGTPENYGRPRDNDRGDLQAAVLFRTPSSRDWKGQSAKSWREREKGDPTPTLPDQIGGQLNPMWVEWLMGFPLGWTDLEDSETLSSRRSRNISGGKS